MFDVEFCSVWFDDVANEQQKLAYFSPRGYTLAFSED